MNDLIERICKDLYNYAEKKHFNGEVELANGILKAKCYIEDEKERYIELAKEPHECNSDLISRKKLIRDLFYSADGNRYHTRDCDNFPITISFEDLRKVINNQPQVQPIVRSTEETKQKLMEYFNIGDSSAYYLTRVKEAFSIGTMTLDDFVEFTESDIDDLIDWLTKKEV